MAGYCTSVWPHFQEPQVSENTAQEILIELLYTTLIKQHLQHRQLLRMCSTKVIATYLISFWLQACFQLWTAPTCVPIPLSVEESTVSQYIMLSSSIIKA